VDTVHECDRRTDGQTELRSQRPCNAERRTVTTQHIGLTSTRQLFATEFMTGCERSRNGAERAKTRVERSGAVSGSQKNRTEWSVSGEPRSGNRAVSGGEKNQVYRGAAKPSAPLHSHALHLTNAFEV